MLLPNRHQIVKDFFTDTVYTLPMRHEFGTIETGEKVYKTLRATRRRDGFTLIELSMVLVIVGLLIGGVMVGKELIEISIVRSQVSQLQNYTTAMYSFKTKYNYLPGDIPSANAVAAGLSARPDANGDGVITGSYAPGAYSCISQSGEPIAFWRDLSDSHLIKETFTGNVNTYIWGASALTATTKPSLNDYFPKAASGKGGYLYVWTGGPQCRGITNQFPENLSYMTISAITGVDINATALVTDGFSTLHGGPVGTTMTAATAYGIDVKIDDGLPQAGRIIALYLNAEAPYGTAQNGNTQTHWAGGALNGANSGGAFPPFNVPTTNPTSLAPNTCYDNGGSVTGAAQHYSVSNTDLNCAISMRLN